MEAVKSFENLSDNEKISFFQIISSCTKGQGQSNVQDKSSDGCTSEKSSFSAFIESLKQLGEKQVESNSQAEKSKSKQKTLDSWLIKREDASTTPNTAKKSLDQNTALSDGTLCTNDKPQGSTLAEPITQTVCIDIDSVDNVSRKRINNKTNKSDNKTDLNENCFKDKLLGVCSTPLKNIEVTTEKYNLRKKRKAFDVKNLSPVQKSSKSHKDGIPTITDSDKTTNNCVNNFSHRLSAGKKEKCDNSVQKEKYNLRVKRKSDDLLQSAVNNRVEEIELNSQISDLMPQSNPPTHITPSPHEAFCLLEKKCNEIGINILDILKNENVQTLLNDPVTSNGDAVVFLGSFTTKTGNTLPVINLARSKSALLEKLHKG